jgi:ABC-type sulfate/molybdate transport systems ATPase subunit
LSRIRDYHRETKSTILLVSHSMEDVSSNANSILVMNKGRCAMHDTVPAVFDRAEELVGMGLDECSMVSSEIAAVRYQIRGISAEQMKHLAERVLAAVTVKEVKQLLER